jgi:hypothetical protein
MNHLIFMNFGVRNFSVCLRVSMLCLRVSVLGLEHPQSLPAKLAF